LQLQGTFYDTQWNDQIEHQAERGDSNLPVMAKRQPHMFSLQAREERKRRNLLKAGWWNVKIWGLADFQLDGLHPTRLVFR